MTSRQSPANQQQLHVVGLVACGTILGATLALGASWMAKEILAFENEAEHMSKEEVYALRKQLFCDAQSISYENSDPLMIVRGESHHLIDDRGFRYLDSRNNPACVGWQRQAVVDAVSRQLAKTNSNTRYLHPYPVLLARELIRTMPTGSRLKRVFFVNSGSEANDLALRLARTHTGATDVVVVERAYHGHTEAVLAISPYKFLGKGGKGCPEQTHVVPCPDSYRERSDHESEQEFASRMAAYVDEKLEYVEGQGRRTAAFFVESGMSVAGVIMPPRGYLTSVYASVRAQGGVCVADEVQVGFGRLGGHFWGFEQQGVDPDIVTMAKPFGNGVPLAAVVCSDAVANSFTNGMEYFNTFGGNPVACAAGLAVLEIIQSDRLQAHAAETGAYFCERLHALMQTRAGCLIGDVRGSGLFLGIEFVRDRVSKEPASKEVSFIITQLLHQHRILTSCDGKHSNVLVIKPPLTFDKSSVNTFVDALELALQSVHDADLSKVQHTPT
ncbi:Alanine--glyoxylate aminotransferase 2-like [Hondaea fermentalgiana]|uniref:Alanine--glyoxylate aminotransferase 2-like n=1 Tax=Hondaea fermentalgiana TaxID=2315210 RepID=A0A2R5GCQ2_9STRA|nr:Alanine--glyoxylate aminotransferase 2-like [Hondaea fermentalgiana]|eukprot:GBG28335.1 Alanine--glyoxylate aminotransferase 2-like [Hondaea fermentalgiana]